MDFCSVKSRDGEGRQRGTLFTAISGVEADKEREGGDGRAQPR